jgi:hypothetical protein
VIQLVSIFGVEAPAEVRRLQELIALALENAGIRVAGKSKGFWKGLAESFETPYIVLVWSKAVSQNFLELSIRSRGTLIVVLADDCPAPQPWGDGPLIDLRGWQGGADARIDTLIAAVRQCMAGSRSISEHRIVGQGKRDGTISDPPSDDASHAVVETPTPPLLVSFIENANVSGQRVSEGKLVFLCYRRDDTEDAAGRLQDRLITAYGADRVFMDIDSVPLGIDFVDHVAKQISKCSAVIVMMGRQWLTITDRRGRRRLDLADDVVRLEIAAALERKIPVIPILVQDAEMPSADDLPDNLQSLARRNGIDLSGAAWRAGVERLIKELDRVLKA